jgi:hypothetical protein
MIIFCQDDIILSQGEQFCAGVIRGVRARAMPNYLKWIDNPMASNRFGSRLINQAQPLQDCRMTKNQLSILLGD